MEENNPIEVNKIALYILGGGMLILIFSLIYLSVPRNTSVKDIEIGNLPPRGDPNASIKIIEFSDFQCPACKASHPIIDRIFQDYQGEVVLYYRYFPLPMHENSFIAAEAAECANRQGRFWEYHNILFENQDKLDKNNLKKYAENLGLNKEKFNICLDNEETKEIVLIDVNNAKKLNLKGTPTYFINGREFFGANQQEIEKIIEEELR